MSTSMGSAWQDTLNRKRALQDERRCCEVFDYELKVRVAGLDGVAPDAYLNMSFAEWVPIKRAYYERFDGRTDADRTGQTGATQ